jgi:hypothetical protein
MGHVFARIGEPVAITDVIRNDELLQSRGYWESEAIAKTFKLTPSELRVLLGVVRIGSVPETAAALGIGRRLLERYIQYVDQALRPGPRQRSERIYCGCTPRPAPATKPNSSNWSPDSPIRSYPAGCANGGIVRRPDTCLGTCRWAHQAIPSGLLGTPANLFQPCLDRKIIVPQGHRQ